MCNGPVLKATAILMLAFIWNGILRDVQISASKSLKAVVVNSTQFEDARASAEQFAAWALKEQKVLGTPLSLVCAGFVIALIMLCGLLVLHKCPQLIQKVDAAGAGGVAMVRALSIAYYVGAWYTYEG